MNEFVDKWRFIFRSWFDKSSEAGDKIRESTIKFVLSLSAFILVCLASFVIIGVFNNKLDKVEIEVQTERSAFDQLIIDLGYADNNENKAKSFKLLADNINNFSNLFTQSQLISLNSWAKNRVEDAQEITIPELYKVTTRDSEPQLYKFSGFVLKADSDFIYGNYITFHNSEEGGNQILIVKGLVDVKSGEQIEFYGVPELKEVGQPLQVEALTFSEEVDLVE